MPGSNTFVTVFRFLIYALLIWCAGTKQAPGDQFKVKDQGDTIVITTDNYRIVIIKDGFRYSFVLNSGTIVPPHAISGLQFGGTNAARTTSVSVDSHKVKFQIVNSASARADVEIEPAEHHVHFRIKTEKSGPIIARTGGVSPAFGLGDHGGRGHITTDLTGYKSENLHGEGGAGGRLVSNFVICPQLGFAEVNVEPAVKIIRLTKEENAQGSKDVTEIPNLFYFFGEPKTIYRDFLEVRNQLGYPVAKPKYEWFGVGWEAFGALAYNTSQKTVTENLDRYLGLGYPISWMVIGSGFWPHSNDNYQATTSFGMWDPELYPDPRGLIERYHKRGLKFILGLRIAFITEGPFAAEGVQRGLFICENGQPKIFKLDFPKRPVYLLDTTKRQAVDWYLGLCQRWLDYGVDGFKEDLFGYEKYTLRDDKLNAVNSELMKRGVYVMGRNGYLGSAMDLHRYEDFNYNQNQDRGPINGLAFAYSGFPNVYPDIVGGKFVPEIVPQLRTNNGLSDPSLKRYFMRSAQYASVNPSMSVGFGPWNFKDDEVEKVVLDATRLHAQLHPYIYSAALDAAQAGYPYPLTPLSLAYPQDTNVYQLENNTRRSYEWLLGTSLLAVPICGNDCAVAHTRDVYLPVGKWMDYDTGTIYDGPATLKRFELPPGKTPLFVGGTGVLILRQLQDDTLRARVYPVAATNISYRFTYKDSAKTSTINNPAQPWHANEMIVTDTTVGKTIPATITRKTRAIEFTLVPGHNYSLKERRL
jgi:alpha-glucosidase (family GH31 glycosyl hydrolase)